MAMCGFAAASLRERALISQLAEKLQANFIAMPELCSVDAIMERKGMVSLVEAKVRNFNHDDFESVLIEKAKYDNLIKYKSMNFGHKVLYVCFYRDKVALVFNLEDFDPEWEVNKFVKTTMGNNQTVDKIVSYLPINRATKIEL